MNRVIAVLFAICSAQATMGQKKPQKATSAASIRISPVALPVPKPGEVKILDQEGVSIYAKEGKPYRDGTDAVRTAVITRVVNANDFPVMMYMGYIYGGKDKKHGGDFSVNNTYDCYICMLTILHAATTYSDPLKTDDIDKSVGYSFPIEDISLVKVVGGKISKMEKDGPTLAKGAPRYGWVVSTFQARAYQQWKQTIYHTVSKVLDLSNLDVSAVKPKYDNGTAKTVLEIYNEALRDWYLQCLRRHRIDNAVDIQQAAGGITVYTTRYNNATRVERLFSNKQDGEASRQHVIDYELVSTGIDRSRQVISYINDDIIPTASHTNAATTGSAVNIQQPGNQLGRNANSNKGIVKTNPLAKAANSLSNSNSSTAMQNGMQHTTGNTVGPSGTNPAPVTPSRTSTAYTPSNTFPPPPTKYTGADITGTWNYTMTWPGAPGYGSLSGRMVFRVEGNGVLSGSNDANPGQRLSIHDVFANGALSSNTITFKVQTPVPEIQQWYKLVVLGRNRIKGTIRNVAVKPTDRPASWDLPAEIELSR